MTAFPLHFWIGMGLTGPGKEFILPFLNSLKTFIFFLFFFGGKLHDKTFKKKKVMWKNIYSQ